MYRVVKLFFTKNGKRRLVEIRRFRDRWMAEYACACIATFCDDEGTVVGYQKV